MAAAKIGCIAAIVMLGVGASGAQAKTLKLKGTERGAIITSAGNKTLYASLGSDQRGHYAGRNSSTTTGTTNGLPTFTSTFTDYFEGGTDHGTLTGTATPAANNGFTFKGTGKITGGTGRYRNARGTLTFTGTQTSDGKYTVTFTGTLIY
jgi:hypothetical protein